MLIVDFNSPADPNYARRYLQEKKFAIIGVVVVVVSKQESMLVVDLARKL